MREIQARDPSFHMEKFMKFTTEHIVPEILDAFLAGDLPTLRLWCSEAMYNMLKANFEAQLKPGCRLEGRVLDMRNLDLVAAKLLDNTPVVVFSFNSQQISYMRDANATIVEGSEDNIENVLYVMALAKEEPSVTGKINEMTQGWKLVELAIRDKNGSW
jgi:import inner membrane translocase subunit TIM44